MIEIIHGSDLSPRRGREGAQLVEQGVEFRAVVSTKQPDYGSSSERYHHERT